MQAIVFDIDTLAAKEHSPYGENWRQVYNDIRLFLEDYGFENQQGSLYFGDENTSPVDTVMITIELGVTYPYLRKCVRDIRQLRIEENNNLMPALKRNSPSRRSLLRQVKKSA